MLARHSHWDPAISEDATLSIWGWGLVSGLVPCLLSPCVNHWGREEHPDMSGAAGGTSPVGAGTWWHSRTHGMCRALAVVRRCHMDSIN